jgi:putative spermidine/putrescine transport system substrate-binding protein/spermidine/putrescine transport system substrate-binding protein
MNWRKSTGISLAALLTLSGVAGCSSDSEETGGKSEKKTLNLLTWEGYADPLFIEQFEKENNVKVNATYFGSSDELLAKLKSGGGSTYDVISPSSDVAEVLVKEGLVEPIDTSKLTYWNDLSPKLRDMQDVVKDGETYGMPFTWGPDYLIYDADVIKEEPKSWDVFFDPQYKGKVSVWDDISNIYLMGQILGYDDEDPSSLYNMTEEQLQESKSKLLELKPQLRKFWATAGELNDLFANKEVVMAVGWPLTITEVNKQGRNLKWTIPQEGATGWIDRLMIVKGSKNTDIAQKYLNYISSPESMAKVAEVTTYSIANPKAAEFMSEELQEQTYVNNSDEFFNKLNFWQFVKDRARYNEVWTEVKTQ